VQAPWFGKTKGYTLHNSGDLGQDHFSDSL
jgi:hypothetical protein